MRPPIASGGRVDVQLGEKQHEQERVRDEHEQEKPSEIAN